MKYISAEDYELLGFFEQEPKLLDTDLTWPYNDSLYEVAQGEKTLSVAICPAYKDIRLIIKEMSSVVFELEAMGVEDIQVLRLKNQEVLEIKINNQQTVILKLKPFINIYQKYEQKI